MDSEHGYFGAKVQSFVDLYGAVGIGSFRYEAVAFLYRIQRLEEIAVHRPHTSCYACQAVGCTDPAVDVHIDCGVT